MPFFFVVMAQHNNELKFVVYGSNAYMCTFLFSERYFKRFSPSLLPYRKDISCWTPKSQYLSICGECNGVVGPTGHLCHPLVEQVGGDECRSQAVVGCAVAQLAVTIVTPGVNLSI